MKPRRLIDVRKSANENDRQFHAKGKLSGDGKIHDKSFTDAIKQAHKGISSVRYIDECSIAVTLYRAFIDDWPKIEKIVFGLICGRLDWPYKKVAIRHHDVNGKLLTKGHRKRFRLVTKQTAETKLEEFLVGTTATAGNTDSSEA